MASLPEAVVAYVADKLRNGASLAESRVFEDKVTPFQADALPGLNVVFFSEEPDIGSPYLRQLRQMVGLLQVWILTDENHTNRHTLNRQVRALLNTDANFGGLVAASTYKGWRQVIDYRDARPTAIHVVEYELQYLDKLTD